MALIGFILFIAISRMIIELFMTILTSTIGFWLKVLFISIELFIVFGICERDFQICLQLGTLALAIGYRFRERL